MTTLVRYRYLFVGAGFFVSGIACLDLLLDFICARFPLLFYLIAAIIGLGVGHKLKTWLVGHGPDVFGGRPGPQEAEVWRRQMARRCRRAH